MQQINNQNIVVGTQTLKTNVTLGMVSDIKNCDFYVKKELVKPINNKIITIKECDRKNHYEVHINYVFFDRIIKITKITNTTLYDEIIKTIEICEANKKNWWGVAEDEMVEELSDQINKDILKNLMLMGTSNFKSNGKFDI